MNIYNVITLFPNLIEEWKNVGIVRQAIKNQLVNIQTTNLRDFGIGEYKHCLLYTSPSPRDRG